jgi:nucleotide-binding universal stress UspA family protein
MAVFQRICCPVDFSDGSREALRMAVELARRDAAGLTVLHATSVHAPGPEIGGTSPRPGGGEAGATELERWAREAEGLLGSPVSAVLLTEPAAPAIVSFARDVGIDLIVLASHGRRGLRRLVLGSVAEEVARTAPCPVLLVRRDEAAGPAAGEGTAGMPA